MTNREIVEAQSQQVVIANELIQKSRYTLTLTQQRILLFIISKIKPNDKPGTEYVFSIKEYKEVCGITKGGNTTKNIIKSLEDMRKRTIIFQPEEHKTVITGWFNDAVIDTYENTMTLTFSKHITPYLFNLRRLYAQFCFNDTIPMKSNYGIRLYEYLISISNLKYKEPISIEDLRRVMGVEDDKYPAYKDLRVRVIEPSIKDINDFTNLEVSFQELKNGRKVSGLDFQIRLRYAVI